MQESWPANRMPVGLAQPPAGIISAGQASANVTSVGLAATSPVDWEETEEIQTVDGDPGGKLQWSPKYGRVRVCDIEPDGHLVRGKVIKKGAVVARVRAGQNGKCDEAAIPGYERHKTVEYLFAVCLAKGDEADDGYCNASTNRRWPKPDRGGDPCAGSFGPNEDHCRGENKDWSEWEVGDGPLKKEDVDPCDMVQGMAKDHCSSEPDGGGAGSGSKDIRDAFNGEKPDAAKAPKEKDSSDKDNRVDLPRVSWPPPKSGEPFRELLGWLVWASFGACMAGIMITGCKMAIKHKRGELGAHATGLGWVALACILGPAGAAMRFMYFVIVP